MKIYSSPLFHIHNMLNMQNIYLKYMLSAWPTVEVGSPLGGRGTKRSWWDYNHHHHYHDSYYWNDKSACAIVYCVKIFLVQGSIIMIVLLGGTKIIVTIQGLLGGGGHPGFAGQVDQVLAAKNHSGKWKIFHIFTQHQSRRHTCCGHTGWVRRLAIQV